MRRPRLTLAGPRPRSYAIEAGVCYLAICKSGYSKKMDFSFLEEIQREFQVRVMCVCVCVWACGTAAHRLAGRQKTYGTEFSTVARPYAFIQFDNTIQRTRKQYDSRSVAKNLEKVNAELVDVQRIMVRNIDEVLQRGNLVSELDDQAAALRAKSKLYLKEAKQLNWAAWLQKWAPLGAVALVLLLFIYWRFLA